MLAISNKLSEPVEYTKTLLEYCEQAYGPESAGVIRPFGALVEELRADAILSGSNTVEAQRNALRRYLGALEVLEEKFPIGQPLSPTTKVQFPSIKFSWSDSFRPRNKVKGASVRFERACVLFNFAANQSLLARDADRSTPEGQKNAVALYQNAAGVFILLRDQVVPQCVAAGDALGMDLSDGAVSMCASLMLAQAQALFYEKAVKDKSSRGLLAKLANQASDFFGTAGQMAKSLGDHIDPSWTAHCVFQQHLFAAAAQLQQALNDKPNVQAKLSGFGALVARLRLARDFAGIAEQMEGVSATVRASVGPLRDTIKAELTQMEFDNTNVYIEVVPGRDGLAPIGLVPAVKPASLSLAELRDMSYVEGHVAAMEHLAPVEVRKKAEQIDAACGALINKVTAAISNLRTKPIAYPLAPGLAAVPVDAHGNIEPISDDLWQKIARIQVLGGAVALEGQLATLHGLTGDCEGIISFVSRALDEEERDDKNCRDRFGTKFARVPSAELTGPLRTQLANYKQKLGLAVDTNRKVRERIGNQDRTLVALLAKSRQELDAIWTEKNRAPVQTAVNPATEKLKEDCRNKLAAAEAVAAQSKKRGEEFQQKYGPNSARAVEMMKSGDIDKYASGFIQQGELECGLLCEDVAEKFMIANTELENAYNALLAHVNGDGSPKNSKGHWLQALDTCATIVMQGFGDVAEGVSFFNKLGEHLRKLKAQVDDFCFARNEEKNSVLQNIQRGLAGGANLDHNPFGNSPQINFQ